MLKFLSKKFHHGDTLIEVLLAIAVFGIVAITTVSAVSKGVSNSQGNLETTAARMEIEAQAEALRFINNAYASQRKLTDTDLSKYAKLWQNIVDLTGDPTKLSSAEVNSCPDIYNEDSTNSIFHNINVTSEYRPKSFIINSRLLQDMSYVDSADSNRRKEVLATVLNSPSTFREAPLYPRIIYDKNSLASDTSSDTLVEDLASADYRFIRFAEGIWVTGVYQAGLDYDDRATSPYYDFYIRSCWYTPSEDTASNISTVVRLYNPDVAVTGNEKKQFDVIFYGQQGSDDNVLAQYTHSQYQANLNYPINITPPSEYLSDGRQFMGWVVGSHDGSTYTYNRSSYYTTVDQRRMVMIPSSNASSPEDTKSRIKLNPGITRLYPEYGYRYTINFHCNGGRLADGSTSSTDSYLAIGAHRYRITLGNPTYIDEYGVPWRFNGWRVGSTSGTLLTDSTYNFTNSANSSVNLYADWSRPLTLVYHFRNGTPERIEAAHRAQYSGSYTFTIDSRYDSMTGGNGTFMGWSSTETGSLAEYCSQASITNGTCGNTATDATNRPKTEITVNSASSKVVHLYALWKPAIDMVFLIDDTGSMSSYISSFQIGANTIAQEIYRAGGQVAVIRYGDLSEHDPVALCGFFNNGKDSFNQSISNCTSSNVQNTINSISVNGGGDGPESPLSAISYAINELNWSNGAKNIMILTDADYHSPDRSSSRYYGSVTTQNIIDLSNSNSTRIYQVGSSNYSYSTLTSETGGRTFTSSIFDNFTFDSEGRVVEQ